MCNRTLNFFHIFSGPAKWIKLGDLDLHNSTDDANSKSYKITGCYPHPKYKKGTNYSDIALFKFSGLVEFNVFIKPLCLSTSGNQIKPGEKPIVTGYGYKEERMYMFRIKMY